MVARSVGAFQEHGALGFETIAAQQMQESQSFRWPEVIVVGTASAILVFLQAALLVH
jgi:hypothetical protein